MVSRSQISWLLILLSWTLPPQVCVLLCLHTSDHSATCCYACFTVHECLNAERDEAGWVCEERWEELRKLGQAGGWLVDHQQVCSMCCTCLVMLPSAASCCKQHKLVQSACMLYQSHLRSCHGLSVQRG